MKKFVKQLIDTNKHFFIRKKNYKELIEYFRFPPRETIDGLNVSPIRYADPSLNKRSEQLYSFIRDKVDNDSKILELGCGIGRNLSFLQKKGLKNLFGIDINQEAITLSIETYSNLVPLKNNLVCSSLEQGLKNYEDRDFNLVFSLCTLMHIHPKVEQKVFDEISRITNNYLLTIEMENSLHHTHFPRDYEKVFQSRNLVQRNVVFSNDNIEKIFGDVTFRLFEKL